MTRKLKARWNISAWFGKKGPVAGKRKAIPFLSPVFFHCIFVFALSQFRGSDYWIEQSMSSAANRFQPVQVVLPGNANYTLTPRWMTSIRVFYALLLGNCGYQDDTYKLNSRFCLAKRLCELHAWWEFRQNYEFPIGERRSAPHFTRKKINRLKWVKFLSRVFILRFLFQCQCI